MSVNYKNINKFILNRDTATLSKEKNTRLISQFKRMIKKLATNVIFKRINNIKKYICSIFSSKNTLYLYSKLSFNQQNMMSLQLC